MNESFVRIAPGDYTDTTGRIVVPYAQQVDSLDPWLEYIRAFDTAACGRRCLRSLVECALDVPEQTCSSLADVCRAVQKGATASRPWVKESNSPYEPFLWRTYEIGDVDYDVVVYRRPRRSWLCKLLCCGA